MDNMVQMLEKYANNLEEIVEQRTSELMDEKKKTDTLLYRMMPAYAMCFVPSCFCIRCEHNVIMRYDASVCYVFCTCMLLYKM